MSAARSILLEHLQAARGQCALHAEWEGPQLQSVRLASRSTPRAIDGLLIGRPLGEATDMLSRICGVSPVAYQIAAALAVEQALGLQVPPVVAALRRMCALAELIGSHAVQICFHEAPAWLRQATGHVEPISLIPADLDAEHAAHVQRGLRIKQTADRLLTALAGRATHPVNLAVGGFFQTPSSASLQQLADDVADGLAASQEMVQWTAQFDFPEFDYPREMIALVDDDRYALHTGRLGSTRTDTIEPAELLGRCGSSGDDQQESHQVGPLARVNLNMNRLSPTARTAAEQTGIVWPCFNPFQACVARAIEMVHAHEELVQLIAQYDGADATRTEYRVQPGEAQQWVEAVGGLLYVRLAVDAAGTIAQAQVIPPAVHHAERIEDDLRNYLPRLYDRPEGQIALHCERLLRAYDAA